ncbi:hypothetical protein P3T23_007432 [Paraburkholderia sp. GAS448]
MCNIDLPGSGESPRAPATPKRGAATCAASFADPLLPPRVTFPLTCQGAAPCLR